MVSTDTLANASARLRLGTFLAKSGAVRISTTIVTLVAALGMGACEVGSVVGGGPGGGNPGGDDQPGSPDARPTPGTPDAAAPDFTVAIATPTTATRLGTDVHYTITITGMNHMLGDVALTAAGVPKTWTATLTPATVTLDASGTATADLDVVIPTNAADLTATIGVSASATPGTHTATMPAALTVANEVVVTIKDGTGTGDHALPTRIDILLGTKVRIMDADTTSTKQHQIHSDADDASGFPHQPNPMNGGQEYDVTPTIGGDTQFRWYCHLHGQGTGVVNLVVH